jgi:hypothetical protein
MDIVRGLRAEPPTCVGAPDAEVTELDKCQLASAETHKPLAYDRTMSSWCLRISCSRELRRPNGYGAGQVEPRSLDRKNSVSRLTTATVAPPCVVATAEADPR